MGYPSFNAGDVLAAADMNAVGLWLVKTQTIGTTVSSVTVTNAFSSTYDAYRIIVNTTGSANAALYAQLGNAGTFSTTGYLSTLIYLTAGVAGVQEASLANHIQFQWIGGGAANQPQIGSFDLINPFAAKYTRLLYGTYADNNSFGNMHGEHRVATSYADIKIFNGTGTLTGGTISIYGYKKA